MSNSKEILKVSNLQSYFFKHLSEINKKSSCPIPEEIIYYSSNVLEVYGLSSNFYETKDGKLQSKILGIKMLEAQQKSIIEQKIIYKDVADTALIVCGYFSNSINSKIVDKQYYTNLGKIAYENLHNLYPELLNIPKFYKLMSTSFQKVTTLISILSKSNEIDPFKHLVLQELDVSTSKKQ